MLRHQLMLAKIQGDFTMYNWASAISQQIDHASGGSPGVSNITNLSGTERKVERAANQRRSILEKWHIHRSGKTNEHSLAGWACIKITDCPRISYPFSNSTLISTFVFLLTSAYTTSISSPCCFHQASSSLSSLSSLPRSPPTAHQ